MRDAAPWLLASIASLQRQTFRDFEIVAVDDGSSDGSGEILERAAEREPRLRVFHTAARGLPQALNLGLAHARAPLVARHDADDLSHRDRLRLQDCALAAHPECAVLGSRVRLFPAAGVGTGMKRWIGWHNRLLDHDSIAAEMLIDSPLAHGCAILRRPWLERLGGWSERGWAEDLDLWLRLLEAGARFAKLPETLYGWRQRPDSATRRDPRYAQERFTELKCEAIRRAFGANPRALRLVGVGASLRRWTTALRATGFEVATLEARRPSRTLVSQLSPPVILVYLAPELRDQWRQALGASGMRELRDFRFVA